MRGRGVVDYGRWPLASFAAGFILAVTALASTPAVATTLLPDGSASPMPRRDFPTLPTLPDLNWADLPIKLTLQDVVTYNDNVFALPTRTPIVPGLRRGDFYNLTLLGANSKFYVGQQTISLNGACGWTRYLHDTIANSSQYNLNGVLNWNFTSRCSGTLSGALSKQQAVAEEQIFGGGINEVRLQTYNETAKCLVWGGFSLLANSGIASTRNSLGLNRLLDNDSKYVAGGVSYDWSALDNSQLLYRHTDRTRPNIVAVPSGLNLAREVIEDDISLTYHREFSPRLNATASAGLTHVRLVAVGPGGQSATVAPHYSLAATWRPGEKISLTAQVARTVGAPQTILANEEVSTSASLAAAYSWTPRTTLNATVSLSNSNRTFQQGLAGLPVFADSRSLTAGLGASYSVTPFINANFNYQYTDRKGGGFDIVVNRVTASMNYAPY